MQYGFTLDVGRIGSTLQIYRMDKKAEIDWTWSCTFNSKGMKLVRWMSPEAPVTVCEEDTFLYPDNVEDDELDLVEMLVGVPMEEDKKIIKLCSLLIAKWSAGHSEESSHEVIRDTLKKWTKDQKRM